MSGELLHLIDYMSRSNMKSLAFSFDAEKAFGIFIFSFSDTVIRCLKSICNSPVAWIIINGGLLVTISLGRGSEPHPVCYMFIEPLAQKISEDPEFMGVSFKGREYKTCLYADDILVSLSDPDTSLPKLMSCLDQYGFYLGYKLNIEKTLLFNYSPQESICQVFKFKLPPRILEDDEDD